MIARLHIYRDRRRRWRWNVAVQSQGKWNIVCQCTDSQDTEFLAEQQARRVICTAWEIDTVARVCWWDRLKLWLKNVCF